MRRNHALRWGLPILLAAAMSSCSKDSSPAAPTPSCSQITLSPTSQSFPGGGGTGAVTVTVAGGCAWTAAPSAAWMAITSGGSGSGPGTVAFTVAGNPSLSSRGGSVTVNGVPTAINQDGTPNDPSCRFELRPASRSITAAGGNFLVQVFALAGCRWTFANGPSWLQVVAESEGAPNGNGNGSVEAHIAANPDAGPRTGQASIAFQTLTVTQDGQSATACTYALSPASQSANAAGAAGSVSINTAAGCSWWIEAEQGAVAWISINSGQHGAGPATIPYTIGPNQSFSSRTAYVVVHGDSGNVRLVQTVTQAAAGCLYTVTPSQVTFTGDGTGAFATVTTSPGDCSWTATATAPWATVVSPPPGQSRTGGGVLGYQIAPNTSVNTRTAEIVVTGLSGLNPPARIQVTQTPKPF
jgi:hypothetical protein